MAQYRYSNNILWGPTYNEKDGMHHIEAASDAEAYEKANRADKAEYGHSFLQKQNASGRWVWCEPGLPDPLEDYIRDCEGH